MRLRQALVPAAVPILALIAALPFVNRVEPVLLGLPFLLFWILGWVLATPALLGLAYLIARRADEGDAGGPRGNRR
jgi:hypothetical protein